MHYTVNQRLNWIDLRSMKCIYNIKRETRKRKEARSVKRSYGLFNKRKMPKSKENYQKKRKQILAKRKQPFLPKKKHGMTSRI